MELNEERRKIQLQALAALEKNDYNGIVILPTGTGKSWVMIEALKNLIDTGTINNIWYLCNSQDLRDTEFVKELHKWGAGELEDKITRMCYQTAYKLENENVDVVLCDEFDFSLTPEYSKVFTNNNFRYKILVSATIADDKKKIAKQIGKVVYRKQLQLIEEDGIVNKSKYHFVQFLMTEKETEQYFKHNQRIAKAMQGKSKTYVKMQVLARKRFLNNLESSRDACRRLMMHLHKSNDKCKVLIFCESNDQASAICKYTYHSDSEEKDNLIKFQEDEINFLAVCGKVNRGTNITGVNFMILESCNGSETQLTQRLGRGKRLNIDEVLNVYFLVPYYKKDRFTRHTKVLDWIYDAGRNLNLKDAVFLQIESKKS